MQDDTHIALLDDHLDGNLNKEETDKLISELEENNNLKELLGILAITRESIRSSGYRQTIQDIHQDFTNNRSEAKIVKFSPLKWWIGIAASLTLILIAGKYWVQNLPENLYEEKYIAYQIPTMRSNGEEGERLENDFINKNWDSVIRSVSLKDNNRKNLFLAGVSYFELGDFTNSLRYLNKLEEINSSSTDRLFEDETDYYLFLSHLKSKNYNKALFFMQKITSDPTHSYHKSFGQKDWVKLKVIEVSKP